MPVVYESFSVHPSIKRTTITNPTPSLPVAQSGKSDGFVMVIWRVRKAYFFGEAKDGEAG
jgi:hypothetical protein